MDIYAPDDLQELRNSPSVVAWPTDLAEFNFLVEANNDYRRGAVSQAFHVNFTNSCGGEQITPKEEEVLDRVVDIEVWA